MRGNEGEKEKTKGEQRWGKAEGSAENVNEDKDQKT